jgi:hypothetical protein
LPQLNNKPSGAAKPRREGKKMKAIVNRKTLVKLIQRHDAERPKNLIEIEIDEYGASYYNSALYQSVYVEYLGNEEWLFLDGKDAEYHYGEE